jgi:hypothetical protein
MSDLPDHRKVIDVNTIVSAVIIAGITALGSSFMTSLRMQEQMAVIADSVTANTAVIKEVRDQQLKMQAIQPYELEALRNEVATELAKIQLALSAERDNVTGLERRVTNLGQQMEVIRIELRALLPSPHHIPTEP